MDNESPFRVEHLPPAYNEADQEAREYLIDMLRRIEEDARAQAAPIMKQLARIDARYAPRMVIFPEDNESGRALAARIIERIPTLFPSPPGHDGSETPS